VVREENLPYKIKLEFDISSFYIYISMKRRSFVIVAIKM